MEIFEFKQLTQIVSNILNENGVRATAFADPSLLIFSQLSSERKKTSLSQIRFYKNSLELASEQKTLNEKQSLWCSLKMLGLRPTSDMLEIVNSDDSVEAYDLSGIQFWRNLKFMNVCNYTIEEVFTIPWQDRYERDPDASRQTEEVVLKILTRQISGTLFCDIKNVLIEKLSAKKFIIDVHHKYISPIYDEYNAVAGFIVVSKVELLGEQSFVISNAPSVDLN